MYIYVCILSICGYVSCTYLNIQNDMVYSEYSVRSSISLMHQFSYSTVISIIVIPANPINNKIMILVLKSLCSGCTYNGMWSRILCNRLCDQKIPHLHRCLVELHCAAAMMKEARSGFFDQAVQPVKLNQNVYPF